MFQARFVRTSSFRLTLVYAGLTGLSFLLLFTVVYASAANFMKEQIDATVATELAEIQSNARDARADIGEVVRDMSARTPGDYYLLQDRGGQVLAGNLPALAPEVGIHEWDGDAAGPMRDLRGRGLLLDDGRFLFFGISTLQLHNLEAMLVRAFLWGLIAAMAVALAGGALVSLEVLRRIDTVSRTSREIISGDLSRRIPVSGRGDEFDRLAASLNAMLDRIQGLMDGLRQVSTDIAHDLRTPLSRLRQRIERAQGDEDPAARHDVLAQATRDLDGVLDTFGALLRIAQIESGARKAGFTSLDLGEVLRTVVEIVQPAIEEKGQRLECELDGALMVRGDRELLTQMFANLLANASRHSPPGSRIWLVARRRPADVEVVTADDGPGVPAPLRARVTERFYRLEASRTTPGSGLGLSLVAAVAGLHDTALQLDDNGPGLRATVRVGLA